MALEKGSKAPEFALTRKTAEGLETVKLEELRQGSKVVVLFFPLAFTSVCTDEMCSVSGDLDSYGSLSAKVVAISVDSPFTQEAWAEKAGITLPLLSDFNAEVCRAYDVVYDNFLPEVLGFSGVAKRSAYVVDSDGVITFAWSSDDPRQLPPFSEIKAALQA